MILIMFGPPGVGKGTQAKKIADRYNIPHLSTGDMFRAAIGEGTPVGVQAKTYLDAGNLVPDDVTIGIIEERIANADCDGGFILDGFPRTVGQVEGLDKLFEKHDLALSCVLSFEANEQTVLERLAGRAEEENRKDDTPEVVQNRLRVYQEQTAPLKEIYEGRSQLLSIDAMQAIEDVFADVTKELDKE